MIPAACAPLPPRPWLVGLDGDRFWQRYQQRCRQVAALVQKPCPPSILLNTADPVEALAGFFAAAPSPLSLWLGNPTWGTTEWAQALPQMGPVQVWGEGSPLSVLRSPLVQASPSPSRATSRSPSPAPPPSDGPIWIPTGGSSGNLRFAGHTWDTLATAVEGFCEHFADNGTDPVRAYCVLPLYHVSGLMQALRCWHTGGTLWVQSFRALQQEGPLPGQPQFLSLVPTQLQRLLMAGREDWLRQFRAILLGGAPPWPTLLARSRQLRLPLAPTYGMTETAAQVATLLPNEFLAGQTGSGRSLPHVTLTLCDGAGRVLPPGQPGLITLTTRALATTYSTGPLPQPFQPGDRGYLNEAGVLQVLGRADQLIFTGGEKVQPEEVEAALLGTGRVRDAVVVGVPDADWGEVVVALWMPLDDPDPRPLQAQLRQVLSPYKCPKHWLVWDLQRSAQGKVNRAQLRQQAQRHLGRGGKADP